LGHKNFIVISYDLTTFAVLKFGMSILYCVNT